MGSLLKSGKDGKILFSSPLKMSKAKIFQQKSIALVIQIMLSKYYLPFKGTRAFGEMAESKSGEKMNVMSWENFNT